MSGLEHHLRDDANTEVQDGAPHSFVREPHADYGQPQKLGGMNQAYRSAGCSPTQLGKEASLAEARSAAACAAASCLALRVLRLGHRVEQADHAPAQALATRVREG